MNGDRAYYPGARAARRRRISPVRWAIWWLALVSGIALFYVVLTPIWIGIRVAAWTAEFRARRRPGAS